jgi:hypothetical protein
MLGVYWSLGFPASVSNSNKSLIRDKKTTSESFMALSLLELSRGLHFLGVSP